MDRREQLLYLYYLYLKKKKGVRVRKWVHPLIMQRPSAGAFVTLYQDLRNDERKFFNYFRMSIASFDVLLNRLSPLLLKQNSKMRDAISPTERLAVSLRYLASGNTFTDLHYTYRLGVSTISDIVLDVCGVIWDNMSHECIPPLTEEKLNSISRGFLNKTQFPHCIGAVDGKHIRIIKPEHTGSLFFNYKDFFSILLLAVVDSEYRFIFVDIGAYGKDCDSTIFKETLLWKGITNSELPIPKPTPLSAFGEQRVPYVFIGDEGFGLHHHLMRPYSGKILDKKKRIFNYRLSRARRYVECGFGILSNKWRIFHRPLNVSVELSMKIVQACCVLHNFVRERDGYNFEDTLTIVGIDDIPNMEGERGNKAPNDIRNAFADFFITQEGSLNWQWNK